MGIHFITFGSKKFYPTVERLKKNAEEFGAFASISGIKYNDLPWSYRLKYLYTLNSFTRGFGYWMWKSYVTLKKLEAINNGDILFYADAGCQLNIEGKRRFNEYIEMVETSRYSNLSFQTPHLERKYTKADVFHYFGISLDDQIATQGQLVGGVFFIKKCEFTLHLVQEWYKLCHDKINLINDRKSIHLNHESFIDHRHDQSLFSVLRKLKGSSIIADETYFSEWNSNKHMPIHAKRIIRVNNII